jgi:hypothetical protein
MIIQTNPCLIRSGSYTGTDTSNRPIEHNLGRVPKTVFITPLGGAYYGNIVGPGDKIRTQTHTSGNILTVHSWTNKLFYVGNATSYWASMNNLSETFYWIATG